MNYNEMLDNARKVLNPRCRVCPVCNGVACKGEIPGVGGVGNGASFIACRTYLDNIKINMDAVHEYFEADTEAELFGMKLAAPVMVAPIGGMGLNYTGYLTETEYSEAAVQGALNSGILAFTGDGPNDEYFPSTLPVIREADGKAIPTIKPWDREKVMGRFETLKDYNVPAVAMDIDSAALVNLKLLGKPAFTKSEAEIREYAETVKVPFIVKGVMTPASAVRCKNAGAGAIVVSNHGGRIMQDTMAPVAVLKQIKEAVGEGMKVLVDGGIRSGVDVFRCLALGADGVLIGRPYAIAIHGGRAEGVELYTEKIVKELKETMLMTDCRTIADITIDKITDLNV